MVATALFTGWATATARAKPLINLAPYNFAWNELTIGAVGHVVMLIFGYLGSLLFTSDPKSQSSHCRVLVS